MPAGSVRPTGPTCLGALVALAAAIAVGALVFTLWPGLDLGVSRLAYRPGAGFVLADRPVWDAVVLAGKVASILYVTAALVLLPASLLRRVQDVLLAGAAMVAAAGWWIAIVELTPAQYRPYIGGSQTNSILELTLGYNGLGRITGDEVGSVGGGGGNGGHWGSTGLFRMFESVSGGMVSWLIPAALILGIGALVLAVNTGYSAAAARLGIPGSGSASNTC